MLNLYDTATSPGTAVVKLLTGKRPLGADTHSQCCTTKTHLLHLVEPVDGISAVARDTRCSENDLNVA
jgi:hypothetical protein